MYTDESHWGTSRTTLKEEIITKIMERYYAMWVAYSVRFGYVSSSSHSHFSCVWLAYDEELSTAYFSLKTIWHDHVLLFPSYLHMCLYKKIPLQNQRYKCAKKQKVLKMTIKSHVHKLDTCCPCDLQLSHHKTSNS